MRSLMSLRPLALLAFVACFAPAPVAAIGASITHPPSMTMPVVLGRSPAAPVMDAISLAQVLLTAVPETLREIAATNLPEASSILWSDFLDGNRPSWFTSLPTDIQSYLISEFAPSTTTTISTTSSKQTTLSPTPTTTSKPATFSTASTFPIATSVVTVTVTTGQNEFASRPNGLSAADKVAIGLAIPLVLLAIAVVILTLCLCRRRSTSKSIPHESQLPTPTFSKSHTIPSTSTIMSVQSIPRPPQRIHEDNENPFSDPRPTGPTMGARRGRMSMESFGSLASVAEEDSDRPGMGWNAQTIPRGSRGRREKSLVEAKKEMFSSVVPLHSGYSIGQDPPISPLGDADDWDQIHPVLRGDRGRAFPAPVSPSVSPSVSPLVQAPIRPGRISIARKPVPTPVLNPDRAQATLERHCRGAADEPPFRGTTDHLLPNKGKSKSKSSSNSALPWRRWVFGRTSGSDVEKSDGDIENSYWKVRLPRYNQYEHVQNPGDQVSYGRQRTALDD
ncbi:hypothetical protein GQ53DRAFT_826573 [Thozetella sp. PMI_491]|nr:hypothetical protein GQ53DRAFT_826573 [Thozetella sp. PMI_491]